MMTWIFSGLIFISVFFGIGQGRMDQVTAAALADCGKAVELTISLAGSMCMWSGLMKIAQESGLAKQLSNLLSPAIRFLFPGLSTRSAAANAIGMNITANLLGLGNAATPLGIAAMKELQKGNSLPHTASNHMVMFVVLNTASLQLIPTTTALLRANSGAEAPLDFMPAAWAASALSVLSGVIVAKAFERLNMPPNKKNA